MNARKNIKVKDHSGHIPQSLAKKWRKNVHDLESQIEALRAVETNLSRRTAALERRNVRLAELSKAKDEFIAVASHQLRTPATGVKQYLGLLLEGYAEPLTESQKIFLEKAYESNDRQLRIIDDLLQVARIDSGSFKLTIRSADIGNMIEETIIELKNKIRSKKIKVSFTPPAKPVLMNVDTDRLRMVFENLIDNAINYSPPNSQISISVRRSKGAVVIEVKDHGVGISNADYPKLFQKFSRIPNPLSIEVGGTGLGLYWADRIVKLHGGKITVSSKLEKGTTFTVVLPV